MSTIRINNNSYSGSSIIINDNVIIIDGKRVDTKDEKIINISITGDLTSLSVDYCKEIKIDGNVGNIMSTSGDIEIAGYANDVTTTSGDIDCGNVKGSVKTTSGDVNCEDIGGSVSTISGNIKNRKVNDGNRGF